MPQMGVDPKQLVAQKPAPAGWYVLRLVGFKPKKNKAGDSFNLNPEFEIVSPQVPDTNKKVFETMSLKFAPSVAAIVHGLGFELAANGDIPGDWIPDAAEPDNAEKWQYKGPLLGKTMEAELAVTKYQNNPENNKIKQTRCKVADCAKKNPELRHPTDLIGKSK